MRPPDRFELLEALADMGTIELSSLVLRVTSGLVKVFRDLERLKREGLVEVEGDESAVGAFIKHARDLEKRGLDSDDLESGVFKALEEHPAAARAVVALTKRGYVKATRR